MIIFEKDNLGRSVVEIVFKNAGSIYAKEGVAYFLANIFNTKGTINKKEKFYSIIEQDAIEFHSSVNREFFTLSIKFLNEKMHKAIKLLNEILTSPNITKDSFEKSKKEIYAKIQNKKNDNDYIASNNLFKTIFQNTPLANPVIGENIENISIENIQNFYEFLFQKEYVIASGGNEVDLSEITKQFNPKSEKFSIFTPKKSDNTVYYKNVEQSYIHFASPFNVDYKNELHLAKIAIFILGSGGFGSRMMEEIRVKRGYAYTAYANYSFKKTYKLLNGFLQTKLENTDDAIKIVKDLINDFQENGIYEEELKEAKQFLIGSEPLRNETLNQRLFKKFNELYLELPENYYEKELKLIQNTTLDEVNNFIKNHPEIKDITFSIVTKE
jgi:predicted Zn-dependent peptidase